MKIKSLNVMTLFLALITGLMIGPVMAKEGKKGHHGGPMGPANGEKLAKMLKLDEKKTKEFMKIHDQVYDEKFKEKVKTCFDKMKDTEKGSDEQKKVMDTMHNEKKEYDAKFQSEVEKAKILTEEQTKNLKKVMDEKKGPGCDPDQCRGKEKPDCQE